MSSEIESLKNEVNQLNNLSEAERDKILADLQFLEAHNKKQERVTADLKKSKRMVVVSYVLGIFVIIYLVYKTWYAG